MQQKQTGQHIPDNQENTTYRFKHNWAAIQSPAPEERDYSEKRAIKDEEREPKRKRRFRIFTWWNLFAVIGLITVIIQTARYIVIPFLVMLNSLVGGGL